MPKTITCIRIFIASPSDLDEERKVIMEVIKELNITLPQQYGILIEPISWETYSFPGAGKDPQDVINSQLPNDYDILLCMFWSRIGTTTKRSKSGTIEEFEIAYKRWLDNNKAVRLMVYFKNSPIAPDKIDSQQFAKLQKFRKSLGDRGIFYSTFINGEDLPQYVRIHLNRQIQEIIEESKINYSKVESNYISAMPEIGNMEDKEDDGFLDLIEKAVESSGKANEVMKSITAALEELTRGTQQSSIDMESIRGSADSNISAYKRTSNKQAENMSDFVNKIKPEIPILDNAFTSLLDSTGRTLILMTDFGKTEENYKQVKNALNSLDDLKNSIIPSRESIVRFKMSVTVLPRVTTKFNHAKHDLVAISEKLISIYDRGLNMIEEINAVGTKVIESWNNGKQGN